MASISNDMTELLTSEMDIESLAHRVGNHHSSDVKQPSNFTTNSRVKNTNRKRSSYSYRRKDRNNARPPSSNEQHLKKQVKQLQQQFQKLQKQFQVMHDQNEAQPAPQSPPPSSRDRSNGTHRKCRHRVLPHGSPKEDLTGIVRQNSELQKQVGTLKSQVGELKREVKEANATIEQMAIESERQLHQLKVAQAENAKLRRRLWEDT